MLKNEKRPGYKKTKVGWIPADWDCVPFARLFEEVREPVTPEANGLYREIGVRSHGKGIFHKEAVIGEALGDKRVFRCQPGALVFNIVFAWEQAVAVLSEHEKDFIASHRFPMFKGHSEQALEEYYLLFFKTRRGKELLSIASPGGAGRNKTLGQKDLEVLPVACPLFPEQKAIAEILSCWDKATRLLEQKIKKKRQITKGMSQKLLSGGIRIKGYSTRWKSTRLGKVALPRKDKIDPRVNGSQVFCIELEHIEAETGRLVGFTSATNSSSLKTHFRNGDVLFGKLRPYLRKCWLADRQGVCSTEIWALVPDISQITSPFLCQIMKTDSFIGATSQTSGTHMPRADWQAVKNFELLLPSLKEQQAIAEVLSTADKEIDALERKLALFKEQKRFLLNNLVTGTIRMPQFCKAARKGDRHE